EAMNRDSGVPLRELRVDGGMVVNELLMQFQADILNVPVSRPGTTETTCLGAAYAAAIATGFWSAGENPIVSWETQTTWQPIMEREVREAAYAGWKKAVERSMGWAEE
ncbi:MAG: FGGY-family carbohydrate kinase, partial [Desulfohalobiaceae bacterium]